jgi:hypothetical protein
LAINDLLDAILYVLEYQGAQKVCAVGRRIRNPHHIFPKLFPFDLPPHE